VTEIALVQGLSGEATAAMTLAASVKSDTARIEAFAHAARSGWFRDAAATEAQLTAHGLSAEQMKIVIAKIQTGATR
jgi:hypothetical protein